MGAMDLREKKFKSSIRKPEQLAPVKEILEIEPLPLERGSQAHIPSEARKKMSEGLVKRGKALEILNTSKPINVGMHGKAAALVSPEVYGEVSRLEESLQEDPTNLGIREELEKRKNTAIDNAKYFLVEEDPERADIFWGLKDKGWRVQEYWPTGKDGVYVSPRLGDRQTTRNPMEIPYEERIASELECMELIGRLHGEEQVMHGHPHGGNMLKDSEGNWVILDAKRAEKKDVGWSNPESIFDAFKRDYVMLGRNLYQTRIERKDLPKMAQELTSKYPISSETSQRITEMVLNEFSRQHSYLSFSHDFSNYLKEDPLTENHKEGLQTLYYLNDQKFIQSENVKGVIDSIIGGAGVEGVSSEEITRTFSEIGVDQNKVTPELTTAWGFLKDKLDDFMKQSLEGGDETIKATASEAQSVLTEDLDYIPGFLARSILGATFTPNKN